MATSILAVRALVDVIANAGVHRDEFFRVTRFDPKRLDDAKGRIELDSLNHAALLLTGDPALGLHMGESVSAAMYSLAGHVVEQAATLREGIAALL